MSRHSWQPWLFALEPERAHAMALLALETLAKMPKTRALLWPKHDPDPILQQCLWDLEFSHPLGLAAGFDKDARALPSLCSMGFAFVEIGTVTPLPQSGNSRPRIFRYPKEQAIINRLGFPSDGMEKVARRLRSWGKGSVPMGINLGKNKDTPLAQALADYERLLQHLHPYADYWVINVSSPNTPGLRTLQSVENLVPLLVALRKVREDLADNQRLTPLLVKIAPDLEREEIQELGHLAEDPRGLLDGFIASNTTISRPEGWTYPPEAGGLSGRPLRDRALQTLQVLYQSTQGKLPIIGVGGIFTVEDAYQRILAGSSLLQSYTGWIYQGPRMLEDVPRGLGERLRQDGFTHISQAIGQGM